VKAPRRHRLADVHRDSNEDPLIALAERLGAKWFEFGPTDGWIVHRKTWTPVEIKRPEREGTKSEMTPLQKRFFRWCEVNQAPFHIWRTELDVMRTLGAKVSA
jgi:hypothetical protein